MKKKMSDPRYAPYRTAIAVIPILAGAIVDSFEYKDDPERFRERQMVSYGTLALNGIAALGALYLRKRIADKAASL